MLNTTEKIIVVRWHRDSTGERKHIEKFALSATDRLRFFRFANAIRYCGQRINEYLRS